jgi:ppGpp synthetase/RelA/SpoT-type nucleotidyltranferase
LQHLPGVHSVRIRVKDPEGLAAKVIRKKLDNPELLFTVESYQKQMTDLIGLRALYIFKYEWRPIHESVKASWILHETPIAYVREGDPANLRKDFADAGCEVRDHPFGYRSNHYLIAFAADKNNIYIAELQTRSIFEEGWSEIDHRVRYPRHSDDILLKDSLAISNRLSGMSDEMGTFIKMLSVSTHEHAEKIKERDRKIAQKEEELNKAISELSIGKKEKARLQKQIQDLRSSSQPLERPSIFSSDPTGGLGLFNFAPPPANAALPYGGFQKTCVVCQKPYTDSPNSTRLGLSLQCPDCETNRKCAWCGKTYKQTPYSSYPDVMIPQCPECRKGPMSGLEITPR